LTPGADCSATAFKVFTFGASEMWGTGSPNWDTIPANLQKGLEKLKQGPVCVMNFAESAYVSTQDVIMLLIQLRSGNVPDLVLFYNIGGDVYAAYQSGRAGVSQNLDQLAARFEQRREPSTFLDRLRNTYSYRLIDALMDKLTIAAPQQEPTENELVTYESMGIDAAKLSDLVVQDYFGNYMIVSSLAQKYGFEYFFFLPPRIFRGNKTLTPEEQKMKRETERDAALSKLYTAVYQTVERKSSQYQNFYSMADIFDHYHGLIWIDGAHVTPVGNRLIAARILDVIQGAISDEKQSKISY
jgi:lysophospholipase L1-like esterase